MIYTCFLFCFVLFLFLFLFLVFVFVFFFGNNIMAKLLRVVYRA